MFSHNSQHMSDYQGTPSGLESLPEDRVLIGPVMAKPTAKPVVSRMPRRTSAQENRNCQIFNAPPNLLNHDPSLASSNRLARESWQTTTSVSSYLDSLDIDFQPASEQSRRSSVATFMTDASADAIIPRPGSSQSPRFSRKSSSVSARRATLSDGEYDEDMIDAYFYDPYSDPCSTSPETLPDGRPETALRHMSIASLSSKSSSDHLSSFFRPESRSSASTSMSSDAPCSPGSTVAIKAAHNNAIVMLRVPCTTSFEEVRKRLYDKFVGQEGVPLSESFTVAYVLAPVAPAELAEPGKRHARSNYLSSAMIADCTQMRFVTSEKEWEQVIVANASTKLTLRILDTPA